MLSSGDPAELTQLLQTLSCRVAVPEWYRELVARRGSIGSPVRANEQRQFARYFYPLKAVLQCDGNLPALPRPRQPFVVLCKDVSRSGIAFLHEAPLYPAEEISLWLPIGVRNYVVRRCRRHHAACYEIGAQ